MVKEQCQIDGGLHRTECAIFDKSDKYVVVASEDTTIKIHNAATGEREGELKGHEGAVLDLVWDNNKEPCLISASADCSFRIWQ